MKGKLDICEKRFYFPLWYPTFLLPSKLCIRFLVRNLQYSDGLYVNTDQVSDNIPEINS